MQEIAKNQYYTIQIDPAKNRIYLTIYGTWGKPENVPGYISDIEKAIRGLKPGFTIVTDASELGPVTQELGKIHVAAQEKLNNSGLDKTAEIVKSGLTRMNIDSFARKSKMKKQVFDNRKEAEAWLDNNQK